MGTTRRARVKPSHANPQKRGQRNPSRHGRNPSAKVAQPVVWSKIPKAGLVYPFPGSLMRSQRGDLAVWSAIKKSVNVHSLTPAILDTIFARIFEEATKVLQDDENKQLPNDPLEFMKILRKRPALREPWLRRHADFLLTVFIILRAARANWHKNPRPPAEVEKHCKTARAIDAFMTAETFYWSSLSAVEWFVDEKGGLDLIRPVAEDIVMAEEPAAEEGILNEDSESGDGLFVKQTYVEMEDMEATEPKHGTPAAGPSAPCAAEPPQESGRQFNITLEQLIEGMRRLNIDVDETALTEAFAKLRINDQARPAAAPRRNGNPFVDDSDEDVVL